MKAKWYKKSKIRKQPSTSSDTSDVWSSNTQSTVDLSQSSQNNSTVIDLSASNIDQEIEEQNELSEFLPSTEVEETSSEDDDQGFQGGLLSRKHSLRRSGVTGGQ